jgi:hypothetical protein
MSLGPDLPAIYLHFLYHIVDVTDRRGLVYDTRHLCFQVWCRHANRIVEKMTIMLLPCYYNLRYHQTKFDISLSKSAFVISFLIFS